jgi:lipid-A-disaccharide synthase
LGERENQKDKTECRFDAVLFDFEKEIYNREGDTAVWVGHPILDEITIRNRESVFREKNNLEDKDIIIGLFPGSRHSEVKRLLPEMLKAIPKIQRRFPSIKPIIAKADSLDESFYQKIFEQQRLSVQFNKSANYELMAYSKLCLVCSGQATLECGIIGTPSWCYIKRRF